ncbi:intradiol ring-cleavage dioxygenase [Nonomuraea sp. NBC_01738]|uniref:intradiol ring-cleavage dioxygenase n=1 Tax=Nonomuraea sp. NBC_01738 TaxID=2976003 RepID=UPI002E106C0D|nr:intradiol ring-cleavage dioxygenase [Nonomuraea sp. NBC_01738]
MEADHHEGQRVSRRAIIAGIGSVGLGALLAACASGNGAADVVTSEGGTAGITPRGSGTATGELEALFQQSGTCVLSPSTTQGPYYFDADKIRSDIREDRPGVELKIAIKVQDSEKCAPVADAVVEIWHCDAAGVYSGAEKMSTGGGGQPGGQPPTGRPSGSPPVGGPSGDMRDLTPQDDKRYLRGAQVTGKDGIVQFTTIWPGWYRGRTVHVHAMVHVGDDRTLTTQVMFDEALNTEVFTAEPYNTHTGRDTLNSNDSIFKDNMLMKVVKSGNGYQGAVTFAVDSDHNGK